MDTSDDDDDSFTDTDAVSAKDDLTPTNEEPNTSKETSPPKYLDELGASEMKIVMASYFKKHGIEGGFLEVFYLEKIDGKIFADFDMDDLNRLFTDMPYGDKKRLFNIKKSILKEESLNGPFLELASICYRSVEDVESTKTDQFSDLSADDEIHPETKFTEIFRTFDTPARATDAYRKHAVFRTSSLFISNLIEPLHCFRHTADHDPSSLKWIAKETVRFACACFSDRTNGTIHFGISENSNKDGYGDRKVVGLQINQKELLKVFYEEIQQSFYKDQLSIVLQCLRPPQFVKVTSRGYTDKEDKQLFVVEIDVVPSYSLTAHDTFYLREENEKNENVPRIYKFDKNVPKVLCHDDLKNYMSEKSKIINNRKDKEMSPLPPTSYEHLREQFLNVYTDGCDKLANVVYPILFLSPLDTAMSNDFASENFEFLLNLKPTAIFDFHSSLDKKCLYKFVNDELERVVQEYTIDQFDRNSDKYVNNPERLNSVLEELISSDELKPWIFCNGYEPYMKPPLNRLDWKKERSEGFREVTRYLQHELSNERALVIFLILSKNYDIMLDVAEEVILKFQNQWIAMSENEKLIKEWRDELLRRDSVDKKTLTERCIIGLPWKQVNNIVKEVSGSFSIRGDWQLPTSTGAICYLKNKTKNELCDLEIICINECENHDISQDSQKLERHLQHVEELFYRGGQVSWWNFYFENDHVLTRSQQERIEKSIEKLLDPKQRDDDTRVPYFRLFHQPGAGGTTTARHTLWHFRAKYRCAVVRKITDQTCGQIERLRCFEESDNPKPLIILIDNGDEEKVDNLQAHLEKIARTSGKNDSGSIYCLLFLCVRQANLPVSTESGEVQLKHELSKKELEWLKRKYQSLDDRFLKNEGVNPKLLISFNMLKENFDTKYIERTIKEFVDGIESKKEKCLIKYLSLINSFDTDFQPVPLSAFDPVMEDRKFTVVLCMGSVSQMRKKSSKVKKNWENTLGQSSKVLLNLTARNLSGGQTLSIVSKLFAKTILDYIVEKENISISSVMIECLKHPMLKKTNQSTKLLKKIIQDILKKREFTADHRKEMFSPIILEIQAKEGNDKAAGVLETGYATTKDPMLAQQIARFYIHVSNWEKAEQYAKDAVNSIPDNSFLWDTYGQIFKKRLAERYKEYLANEKRPTDSEMNEFVQIAMKGIEKFSEEQTKSENANSGRENDAGYYGEVRLIVQLLDLLNLWYPKEDKTELHAYLVNTDNPTTFRIFSEECQVFLQNLHARSEKTMQVLEDKLAQLKDEREGEVLRLNAGHNPRHELVQLRENLDYYLGEQTGEIPDYQSPEATAFHIRRRVKYIGGRSCSSILDLRSSQDGDKKLEEMSSILLRNVESDFPIAYDYVTLITVTLAKNMKSKTLSEKDFKNLVEWSKLGYEMTVRLRDDERPQLEAFMYFVMIHWPTESKQKYNLCPVEKIDEAIRIWKRAFYKLHSKQKHDGHSFRRRETTYYFLGRGNNSREIVYYKDLHCKQTDLDGDALWLSKPVKDKLQLLRGTLLDDGWEIMYTVVTKSGNKSNINIRNSYPSPRSMWQNRVDFYLGFSWNGPRAYIQTGSDTSEIDEQTMNQLENIEHTDVSEVRPAISEKQSKAVWQKVATHNAYSQALRKIDLQLQEISGLKEKSKCTQKEKELISKESRLKDERGDLIKKRCDFVDRT
uniref:Sterile alpha motif domain-containing protein 9-like n=1 Tax=Magallana gigas TaxID=29159 RepID=A0A8W8JSG5_MAGGI